MIPIFAKLAQSGLRWWYAPLAMGLAVVAQIAAMGAGVYGQLLSQALIVLLISLVPLIASRPLRRVQLGLDQGLHLSAIGVAILGVGLIYGVTYLFQFTTPDVDDSSAQVLASMGFGENVTRDCLIIATICIGAPLAEEALFRVGVFRSLLDGIRRLSTGRNWGSWFDNLALVFATVVSAWLFADVHGGEGHDGVTHILFVHGVIYALLFAATGNVLVPILAHTFNNCLAMCQEILRAGSYGMGDLPFLLILLCPVITIALCMGWRAVIPRN